VLPYRTLDLMGDGGERSVPRGHWPIEGTRVMPGLHTGLWLCVAASKRTGSRSLNHCQVPTAP
jgi:hypothetical protein